MSLAQAAAIPALLLLPGIACLRMFLRPKNAVWLLAVPLSVPFTSVSVLVLAAAGKLTLGSVVAANLLLSGFLWMFPSRIAKPFLGVIESRLAVVLGLLFAATMYYYAPPFEYYLGGRDPGIYVVDGIRTARTGSLASADPLVSEIGDRYKTLFFSQKLPLRYMGFQMKPGKGGVVVANFFHLFPAWEALFYLLFGVKGMLYTTPFLACCLLAAVALLMRLAQGEAEAVGSWLMLGASPVLLWFSRFPNSELIAGALVFLGFLFLEGYRRSSELRAGLLGSLFLALAFWARVDAALLGACLFLFVAFRYMDGSGRPADALLLLVFLLTAGANFAYISHTNPDYMLGTFYNLRFKPTKVAAVLLSLSLAAAGLAYAGRRFSIPQKPWAGQTLATFLAALLLYAYFIRPYFPAENVGSPNAGALLALGWYFTHPVVLLALAGVVLYGYGFRAIHWALFSATLMYSALYFYRIRADAEHYWMLRRYLPVICPALVFFAYYALRRLLQAVPGLRSRASAAILILSMGLAGWYVYDSREMYRHVEYRGSFDFMRALADRLQPEDLLILGSRDANDLHIVGPMLSYGFDRKVVMLRTATPDLRLLGEFIRSWKGRVFFAGAGNTNLASGEFSLAPVEQIEFRTPLFDEIYHQRPRKALFKEFQVGWYRVEAKPSANPGFVDVGKYDDGSITGFHLKESYGGVDYRWTGGAGRVFFAPADRPVRSVRLRLNPGPWVPGMERVHVKVSVNGLLLVDLVLRNGYNTYEVPVPAAVQAQITGVPIDVLIESKSWIPRRVLNLPDLRRVGVIVDWVRIEL